MSKQKELQQVLPAAKVEALEKEIETLGLLAEGQKYGVTVADINKLIMQMNLASHKVVMRMVDLESTDIKKREDAYHEYFMRYSQIIYLMEMKKNNDL